jgi:endo-1,4-beta-xylanase
MGRNRLITRRRTLWLGLGSATGLVAAIGGKAAWQDHQVQTQIQALAAPDRSFTAAGTQSLSQRAAAKGIIYGASLRREDLQATPNLVTPYKQECAMMVPEWELKWWAGSAHMRPDLHVFDFKDADWMMQLAREHGWLVRGHTLVWHLSLPHWFDKTVQRQNAEQVLTRHIKTVVGYYAGQIHSWDVVNEAIDPKDGRADGLRKSPWLEFLGPDYIDLAFRLTAQADPKTMLVYNDYGIEYDTPEDEAKRVAVFKLLERLKAKGTPIHALGIQSHLSAHQKINPTKLRKFLADVAKLGLKILITELDVADELVPADLQQRDQLVAAAYEDYLNVVLQEPAVVAVVTWGLHDPFSWLKDAAPRQDKLPVRPLPLDDGFKRKLAWQAIARAFDQAPKR